MTTARNIANYILSSVDRSAGDVISPLKLQKLLYYCQAWHLAIFKTALFDDEIQAWAHGPVVYSQYRRFSFIPIYERINPDAVNSEVIDLTGDSKDLVDEVLQVYGEHSASYLERLTHSEKPWLDARVGFEPHEASTNIITHESMIAFYSALLQKTKSDKYMWA